MSFPSCNVCDSGRTCLSKLQTFAGKEKLAVSEMKKLPQQNNTQPTPSQKRPGSGKDGGFQFKMKMAALIGLRGLKRSDNFELFSNIDGAGNFYDLVYTAGGQRYFQQLKHADNVDKNKLTKGELVIQLKNCFQSYFAIKTGDTFKDIPTDKSEFIISTNKELTPELLKHPRRQREEDIFFKTSDKGEIFSFSPNEKNKEFDLYTLLENYLKESKELCCLCDRHIVTEFLNNLIMVTGQKGQQELDEVIKEEIRKDDAENVDDDVYSAELIELKMLVETWCRATKEKMTATMFRYWLQKAKTRDRAMFVRSLHKSYSMKLASIGIMFADSEISRLQAERSNKRAVHLRSDAVTLCSILLLDCVPQSKCIFVTLESLQCNEKKLLNVWLGSHWEWLIVSCDATVQPIDISKICRDIRRHNTPVHEKKCFIILTHYSVQEMQDFTPIDHRFNFEQLSKESQAMVLDKKIDFQGCEVTMRSVLQRHGNVEHVLGPELVTDLITEETAVNIGGKLHVNTDYYAPRYLKRKIYLKLDVLRNSDSYPDIFAVSGIEKKDLVEIVHSDETVGEFCLDEDSATGTWTESCNFATCRFFILRSKNLRLSFRKLCELFSGEMLHWLKFKDRDLLWKETCGDIGTVPDCIDAAKTGIDEGILRDYMSRGSCEVDEESIWYLGERTVLVVAESGMGKSSTTTQVAWHTKERDPTSWVVRINWNDHTRKLQEMDAETFNLDTLVEFLCSAAFPDSKYTDINSGLLKEALQSSGNVTVLMDEFDEISPTVADKAAVILSELTKTKVGRLWVTSRPVEKKRLENELSVIAYGMKRLSRKSQEDMLFILLKHKAGDEEISIPKLLDFMKDFHIYLSEFIHNDNFTACPLYIKMIATVYEVEVETSLHSEHWIKPRFDLVYLYEKFVERKLHIYLTEKQMADITKPSVLDEHEVSKQRLLMNFEKCALAAILPPSVQAPLHNKKIEDEIKSFLERVDKGKDKTGIVMNVVEGKPQFVNRTFAEYFTARWFSEHFKSNRNVLEHILFDSKYSFVRDMFDRILAKDCPLHCAVLDRDLKRFETVLKGECDVNAVDKGGRTVMHIIAKREKEFVHYKRYIERFIDIFHDYGVSLDAMDCVLQWTPWHYAVKSEDWLFVELLLERNVDRSGLDMIRQKAHDPDYIGPIIIYAAEYGYLLLLEYICSIGVNILQACSTHFPSPLHAAMQEDKLPVIRWLIKRGADCNTRYSDGQTPLFYAVTESSLDVVRALVEEGGASLDVRDDCGRTATDWAKYCASAQSLWKYQEGKWKKRKIVEYLERKKNVNLSNTEWHNIDS